MTTDDRVAIARACYEAYVAKDRTAIEALLAENFHFTSPIDNRLDRATYFDRCWPNSQRIDGFDFIHLVPEGDKVFVTYEGQNTDGHRFRNTEIITVRSNQIARSRSISVGRSRTKRQPAVSSMRIRSRASIK